MLLYLAMLCRLVLVLEFNTQSRNMKRIAFSMEIWNLKTIFTSLFASKTNPFRGNCLLRRVPMAATAIAINFNLSRVFDIVPKTQPKFK